MKKLVTVVALCLCSLAIQAQESKTCGDKTISWGNLEEISSVVVYEKYRTTIAYEMDEKEFRQYTFQMVSDDTTSITVHTIKFASLLGVSVMINEFEKDGSFVYRVAPSASGSKYLVIQGIDCRDNTSREVEMGILELKYPTQEARAKVDAILETRIQMNRLK